MNRYLIEIEEKIVHCVTVLADNRDKARTIARAFDCADVEHLAPSCQYFSVKRLESDGKAGKANARAD